MGALHEIVEAAAVGRLFALLTVVGPIAGAAIAALMWGNRGGEVRRRGVLVGLLIGMLGPVNMLLWQIYNTITDRVGLDTVKNLVFNLALFVLVGALLGSVLARFWRRREEPPGEEPELVGAGIVGPTPGRSSGAERRFEEADEPPRNP
jgi:hypothetical protein